MKLDKRVAGLIAGIAVCGIIWVAPLAGLAPITAEGQHCLALTLMTVVIHMFMGSVMAVLGICVPAFLAFTAGSGVSDIAVAMMVFSAINIHYILPFHNLAILVGEGEDNAGYSAKDAMRMGFPLTAVVFVVVLVEAVWFHMLGLM